MKKEVCFNINQLIRTTLHRLLNDGVRHAHSVSVSSERNETKILWFLL